MNYRYYKYTKTDYEEYIVRGYITHALHTARLCFRELSAIHRMNFIVGMYGTPKVFGNFFKDLYPTIPNYTRW